jgi:hypothetical protein
MFGFAILDSSSSDNIVASDTPGNTFNSLPPELLKWTCPAFFFGTVHY